MDFENKNTENKNQVPSADAQFMHQPETQSTQPIPMEEHSHTWADDSEHHPAAQPHSPIETQSYATYQEWAAAEHKRTQKQQKRQMHKDRKNRKPLLVAGSIACACALFAGGVALGGFMNGGGRGGNSAPSAVFNANLPSVNISAPTNTVSTSNTGLSGEEIYAKVSPSVVSVQAVNLQDGKGGTGSGVIMSRDGYVITNHHVVTNETTGAPLDKITVVLADGTMRPAEIKGVDKQTDLAVLKIDPNGIEIVPAEFGDSKTLQPGEAVFAIGSPGGLELANTITGGHISALNRDITIEDRVMSLIQTDAAINPGNSGGALINKYGQVIGITSAKLGISYFEGLGFAIPMDTAKPIVDELIQSGYVAGRPQIGISGQDVSVEMSQAFGVPQGVQVYGVDSRSNAAAAGVQVNDIIIGVNGKTITGMAEINKAKEGMKAGDKLTLRLYRLSTGKELTVSFALNDQHDLQGIDPQMQVQQEQQQRRQQQGRYYNDPFSFFFGR